VTSGRFNAVVNGSRQFGANAFNGDARWLEIAVRCPAGSGAYTTLNPRQPLTATPYALFAASAAEVSWSGLLGIPAGFADNVDNDTTYSAGSGLELDGSEFALATSYQLPQSCSNNEVPTWNGSSWLCGVAGGSSQVENVIVVAKSGGDFSRIQDALDSVTDATADNRYLIWVAPGVYEESIALKPFVRVEGAGREQVIITASGGTVVSEATVTGADDAELLHATVESTGNNNYAVAIYNSDASPRLAHLTILSSDGDIMSHGIYTTGAASPQITHVTVTATSNASAKGISSRSDASVTVKNAEVTVGGCNTSVCYATEAAIDATLILQDVVVTGTSGNHAIAVFASQNSVLSLNDVTATASAGASNNTALFLITSDATVRDSVLTGDDSAGGNGVGISTSGGGGANTVTVHNSEINGALNTVKGNPIYTINAGNTLLSGGSVSDGGGTITCAGVYDEAYTFYASSCP
jgi:hypothetical protein